MMHDAKETGPVQDAPRPPEQSDGYPPSPYPPPRQEPPQYGQPQSPPPPLSPYPQGQSSPYAQPGYSSPQGYPPQPGYQGYPPQPGYPPPPYPYVPSPYPPQPTSGLAIASLICGIVSFILVPLLCGIAAVITGHLALKQIKQSNEQIKGRGLAIAGLIIGYLNILLWIGIIIIVIVAANRSGSTSSAFLL